MRRHVLETIPELRKPVQAPDAHTELHWGYGSLEWGAKSLLAAACAAAEGGRTDVLKHLLSLPDARSTSRQPFDHPDVLTHAIHGGSMPVVRCAVSEDAKKLKIFSSANCFVDSVELPVPIWHLLKEDIASLHERNYPLDTAAWRGHIEILRRQSRVPAAGLSSANFEGPAFENGRDEALLRAAAAKPPLRGPDRRAEAVRLLLDLGAGIGDPALFDPSRPARTPIRIPVIDVVLLTSGQLEPNLDVIRWAPRDRHPDLRMLQPQLPLAADFGVSSRLLIEAKSDLSALDKGGRTPLHAAAALNSVALVRSAPLHLACEALAVDTALLLLERGADPHRAAAGGARPLHCCAWPRHNSSDPVREAEEARNNLEVEEVRARILAIADALLAAGAEIDAADDDGATFFTIAAASADGRDAAFLGALLERGADVNAASKKALPPPPPPPPPPAPARRAEARPQGTALAAVAGGPVEDALPLVRFLLSKGADPNAGRRLARPIASAALAAGGRTDVLKVLLDAGATLDAEHVVEQERGAGPPRPLPVAALTKGATRMFLLQREFDRLSAPGAPRPPVERARTVYLLSGKRDDGALSGAAARFLLTAFIATLEGTEPEAARRVPRAPAPAPRGARCDPCARRRLAIDLLLACDGRLRVRDFLVTDPKFAERFASEAGAAEEGMRVWRGAVRLAALEGRLDLDGRGPGELAIEEGPLELPEPDLSAALREACLLGLRLTALRLARAAPSVHTPAADALGRAPLYHAAARGPAMLDVCGALLDRGAELTPAVLNATRDGEFRRALKERAALRQVFISYGHHPVDVARFALRLRDRLQSDGVMARPRRPSSSDPTPLCCG
eukprot:tig00020610_g12088.t1